MSFTLSIIFFSSSCISILLLFIQLIKNLNHQNWRYKISFSLLVLNVGCFTVGTFILDITSKNAELCCHEVFFHSNADTQALPPLRTCTYMQYIFLKSNVKCVRGENDEAPFLCARLFPSHNNSGAYGCHRDTDRSGASGMLTALIVRENPPSLSPTGSNCWWRSRRAPTSSGLFSPVRSSPQDGLLYSHLSLVFYYCATSLHILSQNHYGSL